MQVPSSISTSPPSNPPSLEIASVTTTCCLERSLVIIVSRHCIETNSLVASYAPRSTLSTFPSSSRSPKGLRPGTRNPPSHAKVRYSPKITTHPTHLHSRSLPELPDIDLHLHMPSPVVVESGDYNFKTPAWNDENPWKARFEDLRSILRRLAVSRDESR